MKRGVEAGDGWRVRQRTPRRHDAGERAGLVQWREVGQLADGIDDAVVDQHCLTELRTAVHHAMTDDRSIGARVRQEVGELAIVSAAVPWIEVQRVLHDIVTAEQANLESARPGVDDGDERHRTAVTTSAPTIGPTSS